MTVGDHHAGAIRSLAFGVCSPGCTLLALNWGTSIRANTYHVLVGSILWSLEYTAGESVRAPRAQVAVAGAILLNVQPAIETKQVYCVDRSAGFSDCEKNNHLDPGLALGHGKRCGGLGPVFSKGPIYLQLK